MSASQPPSDWMRAFSSVGQLQAEGLPQPVGRHFGREQRLEGGFRAAEVRREDAVEAVEVALVLDEDGAGEEVELFDRFAGGDSPLRVRAREGDSPRRSFDERDQPIRERLEQRQEFRDAHRHAGRAEHQEEADQHGADRLSRACPRAGS